MQEEEKKISKYSSGVNIIIRLDILWKDTHLFSRHGLFSKWNATLDRIWLELARDIKPENYKTTKTDFDGFDTQILEQGNFKDNSSEGFKEPTSGDIEKRDKHYKILMDKQLFLARLENEYGKGTTFGDDDDDFD